MPEPTSQQHASTGAAYSDVPKVGDDFVVHLNAVGIFLAIVIIPLMYMGWRHFRRKQLSLRLYHRTEMMDRLKLMRSGERATHEHGPVDEDILE